MPLRAFAYGEPDERGVPNKDERLLLVFTSQARQDPHAWPGWDTSKATPAARRGLAGDSGLFTAARIHAEDMAENSFFSHDSSDGTSFTTRVSRHFAGFAGENLFLGV